MAIDINLNTASAAQLSPPLQDAGAKETAASGKKLTSILGGSSLTVSEVLTTDFSTLVERMRNEQERTKFLLLFTSLQSLNMSLSSAEKAALKQGLDLSDQLEKFEKELKELQAAITAAPEELAALTVKISAVETQIELAQQEGKDHLKLVEEEKRLLADIEEKKRLIKDGPELINNVRNKISEVNGKLSVVASSIGENALKTIAHEIANVFGPEKNESNAEELKRMAKEDEVDPFRAIRKSLDKFRTELLDTIAENTSEIKA